jgi:hypothetical protein
MNATAEMQWRSPVYRSFSSLKAALQVPTTPFLANLRFADHPGICQIAIRNPGITE